MQAVPADPGALGKVLPRVWPAPDQPQNRRRRGCLRLTVRVLGDGQRRSSTPMSRIRSIVGSSRCGMWQHRSAMADGARERYDELYQSSLSDPETFWLEAADRLVWTRRPERAFEPRERSSFTWFPGGRT